MSRTTEWALYPWFEESGRDLVHPDDIDRFKALATYGKVFAVQPKEDGFVKLAYGPELFRVNERLLQPVEPPAFAIGDHVQIRNKDGSGVVEGIQWHHKDEKPFFIIRRNGKVDSKRYWSEDLVRER